MLQHIGLHFAFHSPLPRPFIPTCATCRWVSCSFRGRCIRSSKSHILWIHIFRFSASPRPYRETAALIDFIWNGIGGESKVKRDLVFGWTACRWINFYERRCAMAGIFHLGAIEMPPFESINSMLHLKMAHQWNVADRQQSYWLTANTQSHAPRSPPNSSNAECEFQFWFTLKDDDDDILIYEWHSSAVRNNILWRVI